MHSATGLAHSGHILPNSDEYTSDVSVDLRLFTLLLLGLHNKQSCAGKFDNRQEPVFPHLGVPSFHIALLSEKAWYD